MPNLNRIQIIGHVGADAEMRFTPSGKPVTNFNVAVNRKYQTPDGEKKENTEWFSIVAWNKLAETCSQFVAKGMTIFVSGRVQLHKWESSDGGERSRMEIYANTVLFLDKKSGSVMAGIEPDEIEPDDIPF